MTDLATNYSATTAQNVWYDLYVEADGTSVKVWRAASGGEMELVFSETVHSPAAGSSAVHLWTTAPYSFDNYRIMADGGPTNIMAYTYNNADELTSMVETRAVTDSDTSTFAYDRFGQMTSWTRYGVATTYDYTFRGLLAAVDIGNDSTDDVTYRYDGFGGLRERAALGGGYAWYNDFTQEDSQGNVVQTFFGNGVKDSSGWTFAFSDLYGTPRRVCDASKNTVRMTEFTPYGLPYLGMASGAQGGFTGHTFDDVSGFHRAAYRNYSPVLGRWTSREPSGIDGPNLYWYSLSKPSSAVDIDGRCHVLVAGGVGAVVGGVLGGLDQYQKGCGWKSIAAGTGLGAAVGGVTAAAGAIHPGLGMLVGAALGAFDGAYRSDGDSQTILAGALGGAIGGGLGGIFSKEIDATVGGAAAGLFLYFGQGVDSAIGPGTHYFKEGGGTCLID